MNKDKQQDLAGAYIDKELDHQQTSDFEASLLKKPYLLDQVAQYSDLKDQIKNSYQNEHSQHYHNYHSCKPQGNFKGHCKQAIAAGFILLIGIFTLKSSYLNTPQAVSVSELQQAPMGFKLTPVKLDQNKLLLHISSSDKDTLEKALTEAESLLTQYKQKHRQLKLEVIANSNGVDLMRASVSPYAQRIRDIQKKFDNVEFVACLNTIKRLAKEGKDTTLLPGVTADQPVVDKIINRIQHGWTYIKI